jgi:hypothetical protein
MTWGLVAVIGIGLVLTYIIWQETRSHLHWRELVRQGNVWAIHELVTAEIERWHRMRPPAGTPLPLWSGVQTAEMVSIGRDHLQLACGTEGEYRMVGTQREQVTSPIEAAMRLAAKLVEMVMYDIPEVKLATVRVDVYSTLPSVSGTAEQGCILTTTAKRDEANSIDWDSSSAREIVGRFVTRFELDGNGAARGIDPGPPLENESIDEAIPDEVRRRRSRSRRSSDIALDE